VPDYDLTRLGSRAFEQLIVSLCRVELGAGMQVFGDGPDGGREATFEGTILWSSTAVGAQPPDDQWSGYTVIQSKYMLKPSIKPRDNALWFQEQIRGEIAGWGEAAESGSRSRLPDYLIFVTNVDLSAVAKTGGIDTVERLVTKMTGPDSDAHKKGLHLRGVKLWHADQVRAMIDAHQDIRFAFDGLLTVGDVLAALGKGHLNVGSLDLEDPLRQELVAALAADRWVRLSQSGGPGEAKLWLDDIAVDVPGRVEGDAGRNVRVLRHALERGDLVLRARQPDRVGPAGLVLVGGPGQGKSTLSQMIAQAYRASLLDASDLAPRTREVVNATTTALRRLGLQLPANRRWPVRIDLAKYAEHLSTGAETNCCAGSANASLRVLLSTLSRHNSILGSGRVHGWLSSTG
jgi:hypothetical protein